MKIDHIIDAESIVITLDVDAFLFDKIKQIAEAGFSVVEINGVESAVLVRVLDAFPALRIGAGNVLSTQQLEDAYQAGAHFVTSPGFLPELAQTAEIYSINYLPGVATLSEAMHAFSLGCQHVRPFPATLSFCTLINKYLPLLRLFPAEIKWDEAAHFLRLPAVAAVSLINPDLTHLRALETV